MTLTTHSVVAASIAVISKANPLAAFCLGVTSHFLLDSVPHWDYPLMSGNEATDKMKTDMVIGKSFYIDLLSIATDASLGLFLGLLFLPTYHIGFGALLVRPVFCAIVGSMLPDFLQFVYFKTKSEPFTSIYRFHMYIHSDYRFAVMSVLGIGMQVLIVGALLTAFLVH